jgi:hypothetical protein
MAVCQMPVIDLKTSDATYISCDHPNANYRHSRLLIAANDRQNNITAAILLKFRKPAIPAGYVFKHAALHLNLFHSSPYEDAPSINQFNIYKIQSEFTVQNMDWEHRPKLSAFPCACIRNNGSDYGINCILTELVTKWFGSHESSLGIAIVARSSRGCLMIDSRNSDYPPILSLHCIISNENHDDHSDGSTDQCPETISYDESVGFGAKNLLCNYTERMCYLYAGNEMQFSPAVDISRVRTLTFFIQNLTESEIEAILQISPNGLDFMDDKQRIRLASGAMSAITPYLFARYARIGVISPVVCENGQVKVWFQAQSLNYRII